MGRGACSLPARGQQAVACIWERATKAKESAVQQELKEVLLLIWTRGYAHKAMIRCLHLPVDWPVPSNDRALYTSRRAAGMGDRPPRDSSRTVGRHHHGRVSHQFSYTGDRSIDKGFSSEGVSRTGPRPNC